MPHIEMLRQPMRPIQSKYRKGPWACAAIAVFAGLVAILYGCDPGFIRTVALIAGMLVYGYCVRCCFGIGRSISFDSWQTQA